MIYFRVCTILTEGEDGKEIDTVSVYIKPIQASPVLEGKDAVNIIKQAFRTPTTDAVKRNKDMLEMRKSIERK